VALVGLTGAVSAQTRLPSTVAPGRIEQQFQPPPEPRAMPEIVVAATPDNAPPPGADQTNLQLDAIVIEGSTVYPSGQLQSLAAPYLRKTITLADLFKLADEITRKYRADGDAASGAIVPAQRIGATARIVIIEHRGKGSESQKP
jgi:hemolysin activation/secretion protein